MAHVKGRVSPVSREGSWINRGVTPSRVTASENQQDNSNSQDEGGKVFNKLHQTVSERHRIKYSQDHVFTPDEIKPIPGTRGRKAQQMVQLITKGHLFFLDKMQLYNSTVFKCNFFGTPFVAITDYDGMEALLNTDMTNKEPGFGNFKFNSSLLDGYVPSMFSNGERHRRQKRFLITVSKFMQVKHLLPAIMDIMPEHLVKWNFKQGHGTASQEEWEERILILSIEIMSETLLGIRLDGERFLHWRWEVLKKSKTTCGRPSGKYRRALDAFEHLRDAIANCKTIDKYYREGAKHGLSEEETVLELLWMLCFNAAPGTGAAMRSAAARLSLYSEEEKAELREEMRNSLGTLGLTYKTLQQMEKLDDFVHEVLRMHPPVAMFFGVARRDFVLQSKSGNFQIRRGERLIGNCHIAQRDPQHFSVAGCKNPDEFDPTRFKVQPDLKLKSICAHGLMSEKPSQDDHKCAGTHLGIITIKAFVMYLVLFCDWELEEKPYWTRKTLIRYGNPDEPIRLKQFRYKRDKEELLIPDELESSSDISDELNQSKYQDASSPGCPFDT